MNSRRPMLKLTALGLALVSACSFTVPSENEVFGGAAGKGGSSSGGDTNTSGTLGSGAAPDTNAGAGGMAPTAGHMGLRAGRAHDVASAPSTALADLPSDQSYLDIPAFLRRQAD